MKPRTGGGAVTTSSVSPTSGSSSRCNRPGLASGTTMLASAGSVMLRNTINGCGGACIFSASASVQAVPLPRSSLVSECNSGRLRRMRIAWPFSSGKRLTSPTIAPPLARIGSTSSGFFESNTSQTVSPRRNDAAGVGPAKENFRRNPSLSRVASTVAPVRRRRGWRRPIWLRPAWLRRAWLRRASYRRIWLRRVWLRPAATAACVAFLDGSSDAGGASFAGDPDDGRSATEGSAEACRGGGEEAGGSDDDDWDCCASGSAAGFAACSGLLPIFICCAMVSEVGGMISSESAAAP